MAEQADTEVVFIRFTLRQRIEHLLLILSFTMLCVSGLPQRFFGEAWAQGMISLMGGLDTVRFIHHLFGVMLVFEGIYHIIVVGYELIFTRSKPTAMLPRLQDFKDAYKQVAHLVGMRAEGPQFGRYDFRHKLEYWSVVWGTLLMAVTGLILLFPVFTTSFLPGASITAAKVAHSYEALLAFLAILLWHFYHTHFSADAFPMDTSIFTGKISVEKMREEHPLEYDQWKSDQE